MFFDTHVHFDGLGDETAWREAVQRAGEAGVSACLAVGGSAIANGIALQVGQLFPTRVQVALGYDREQARSLIREAEDAEQADSSKAIERAITALRSSIVGAAGVDGVNVAAVGEMGLDFYHSPDTQDVQIDLFRAQLELARQIRLPVIIHSRASEEATLKELRNHWDLWEGADEEIGVLHCFTGSEDLAEQVLDMGFHISFSGIVTFPKTEALHEVVRLVPEDRLLIETDTPYLAPVPHRGKPNEPAYLREVADAVASLRNISMEALGKQTTENAQRLFYSIR